MGSFAEFERSLIRERQEKGLLSPKKRGALHSTRWLRSTASSKSHNQRSQPLYMGRAQRNHRRHQTVGSGWTVLFTTVRKKGANGFLIFDNSRRRPASASYCPKLPPEQARSASPPTGLQTTACECGSSFGNQRSGFTEIYSP
jgi:hypothetical protein